MWRAALGWVRRRVWLLMVLAGVGLVLSDRVAAWRVGDRAWIANIPDYPGTVVVEERPWPEAMGKVVFPKVEFGRRRDDSWLMDAIAWMERHGRGRIAVNWQALARVGADRLSTVQYEGTNVRLTELLDALSSGAVTQNGRPVLLGWAAEPERIIYLTTAEDLQEERRWRAQRAADAGPELRRAIDHRLDYAKLRQLSVREAIGHCQRLSGVQIDCEADAGALSAQTDVLTADVTIERVIELVLRRSDWAGRVPLRLRADGDRLVVFQPAEGQ